MTVQADEKVTTRRAAGRRRLRGVLVLAMGCLAILAPFFAGALALTLAAVLLIVCGVLEMLETFHAPDEARRRSTYLSGIFSVVAGLLIIAQPQVFLRGLALFVAGAFLLDGLGKLVSVARSRTSRDGWKWTLAVGLVNVALALVLIFQWPVSGRGFVVILVGIRVLASGWAVLRGREAVVEPRVAVPTESEHPDRRLGLPANQEFADLQAAFRAEDDERRRIDAAWCWTFVAVFFAIHIGRMNVEWNLVGLISPFAAVVGDVATALLISFGIILPTRLGWRKATRPVERRVWNRLLERLGQGQGPGLTGRLSRRWLVGRLRFSRRMADIRHSPRAALRWGLRVGLPATAILIAVNPIWGFSWFFNSESWATEVWHRWAAQRTDTWREHMIAAVEHHYGTTGVPGERLFTVAPEGIGGSEDFSFLVLGDTGEGGAAQHSLRDQVLFLGQRTDVKFLAISSDVIYPAGAMSDYEPNFYLPFKGFTKPIYAIPGNHDWYDALEGFAANFFEGDAARATMHARVAVDNRLTTTTDAHIDNLVREAARLRREYGVSTGWQRGPFFDVQTDRFALIAVDTGVLRQVETRQWQWLRAALDRARGKFTMVILGHPLYAGGRYQGGADEPIAGEWTSPDVEFELLGQRLDGGNAPFAAIHQLLREYEVEVVLAGDTHYLEFYQETYRMRGADRTMYHFVNGGGGAYVSIGTPLDWPRQPAVPDCGFYPRKDFLIAKLDRETPRWKQPLWWWAKYLRGWPLTAETLSAAFVFNRSPFLQSFIEIKVERSQNRVRLVPHGVHGPLRWRELEAFGALRPEGQADDEMVEFVIPMKK